MKQSLTSDATPKFYNVSAKKANSYEPARNYPFNSEDEAKAFIEDQKKAYGEGFWQFEITPVSHDK